MTAEREKAINEWLSIHCRMCANNDDRGTDFLNCQVECEVQKDVGIACIHYEEYIEQESEEGMTLEKKCEELSAENDDLRDQLAMRDRFQKQEPCGDVISRQWLMECVNEGWIKFDTEKDKNRFIHLVRDIAPSTTPQPMTEISETEIKPMTKEQIYMRGYKNGKSYVLGKISKIKAEIKEHADRLKDSLYGDGMRHCIAIIDKYRTESEV